MTRDIDLEKLAQWMIRHGFATGHGDSIDDLLGELTWQVEELKERLFKNYAAHAAAHPDGKRESELLITRKTNEPGF